MTDVDACMSDERAGCLLEHEVSDSEALALPDSFEASFFAEQKLSECAMGKAASMTCEDPFCEARAIEP